MSTVYNAPISSNEADTILGTTKPTAKAVAAKVIARAKAKAPATKPSTKQLDAKIDALLGHKAKPATKAPATVKTAKSVKTRKAFQKYDEAFCAKVIAYVVKGGHNYHEAKREFGCSAHWVGRLVKNPAKK